MSDWWHQLSLQELDQEQWEALCDGCARCCLHKLQDEDSGEIFYTRIHCRYLDQEKCRCGDYTRRLELVPECVSLGPDTVASLDWLPDSCAYRLRSRGEPLPEWHYLVSGSRQTVHQAGASVRGRTVSEEHIHPEDFAEHIVTWVGEEQASAE
ncbi:YcgN family cysteine cluster protein [Seongchinamella sediminis]|uniref:UPF0260 protein DWB85_05640 n=1 Tax=Seongchinamella sediminis TaxID=2283635 RepID=A0A3L7E3A6_9GAMM|nr:YcgN family cysteine cluster protein [Seongchinamella sediminis]RLQ22923.1 YcgN family cysteine cluster protein [Seongchinamella sediminis]